MRRARAVHEARTRALILALGTWLAACVPTWLHSPTESQDDRSAGLAAYAREDYHEAISRWVGAITRADAAPDAELLLWLSRAEEIVGDWQRSLADAREASRLAQERSDPALAIDALNASSTSARRLGALDPAGTDARQALARSEALGDSGRTVDSLINLGALQLDAEDPDAALQTYARARELAQTTNDPLRLARATNGLGGVQRKLGRYAMAVSSYREALALATSGGSRLLRARIHGNLCSLYVTLASAQAQASCNEAISIAKGIGARSEVANALKARGAQKRSRGYGRAGLLRVLQPLDLYRALSDFRAAAEIELAIGDRKGHAKTLVNIGDIQMVLVSYATAESTLERARAISRELDDRSVQAAALGTLGRLESLRGDRARARDRFREALALQLTLDEPEMQWRYLDNLSLVYAAERNAPAAIELGKQAVDVLQGIRAQNTDLPPDLLASYVAERTDVYRRLAELLLDQDRTLEAVQILELMKQQEYDGIVRRGAEQSTPRSVSLDETERKRRDRYVRLTEGLVEVNREVELLRERDDVDRLGSVGKARLRELQVRLREIENSFDAFLDELRSEPASRTVLPAVEVESLSSFQITLEELDRDATVVFWLPGRDRLHIVVASSRPGEPPIHRESPIPLAKLRRWIAEYRVLLETPGEDPRPMAKQLYDALLGPIESLLEERETRTILGGLDGDLRYIPFAALHDGERYVAQRWAFVVYTAATRDRLAAPVSTDWNAAALGTSVAHGKFPALPGVVGELAAIIRSEDQDSGSLPGIQVLDAAFTRKSLGRAFRDDYRVIHIASHFDFGAGNASTLLLGDGSLLPSTELDPTDFPMSKVELLTLSACKTGLGERSARGAEIESFAVYAQKKGAKSVVSTLWSVADRSTSVFMEKFYALHETRKPNETRKISKAEALRLTQELFIVGRVVAPDGSEVEVRGIEVVDGNAPYSHPFFWAPFTLAGNWL